MARVTHVVLALAAVLLVALALTAVLFYHSWQPWAAAHTGAAGGQESGGTYAYWSGFGSVFPWSIGVLTGVFAFAYQAGKRVNCHTHGCLRIGSYPVGGYKVCRKHHFEVKGTHPTIDHLKEVHNGGPCSDQERDSGPGLE